ncbi:MAG: hypothetical protein IIX93_03015 [Clostridia bacterium]|nr:hypothetical protein [Clostridia bacterium]
MFDKLFSDSGSKVKRFARIVFAVFAVLLCIALVASLFEGFGKFFVMLIISAVGMLWLYIMCLMISAIGEMVESVSETRFINAQILKELKKMSVPPAPQPMPAPVIKAETVKEAEEETITADEKKAETVKEAEEETITADEKKAETVQTVNDPFKDTLAYALRFSTDEGVRGWIAAKRSQTTDMKEAAVYDALLRMPDDRLRAAIETYLAEE